MVRLCGACLGLLGFAITILRGLWAGNPVEVILARSVWAMIVFCGLGLAIGWVAWRILQEHAAWREEQLLSQMASESDTPPDAEGPDRAQPDEGGVNEA